MPADRLPVTCPPDRTPTSPATTPPLTAVLLGISLFLGGHYALALWRLTHTSGGMDNKFSALAREQYLGFLIRENLMVLLAYALLGLVGLVVIRPLLTALPQRWFARTWWHTTAATALLAWLIHAYFTLRMAQARPYFLSEAAFGHWYDHVLAAVPSTVQPTVFWIVFSILPWLALGYAALWHLLRLRRHTSRLIATACTGALLLAGWSSTRTWGNSTQPSAASQQLNFLIIGSDSLRADKLGCYGYQPKRRDGEAAKGVSPHIDALAARSTRFESCYTAIASTMESGTQLIASQYPHTFGLRHMYPDRSTIEQVRQRIVPLTRLLKQAGYATAVIGDWCAGYNEVVPLEFERLSVSSFDNFKIYMSQAVIMAHFVIPLYFDHDLGYRAFPQLQSFAQFVTPKVVTDRVRQSLESAAASQQPFFYHVFYSCNHLPYRSNEPYNRLFSDPDYRGKHRNGVDFDVDAFIGGTDLESKWRALPPQEIEQIRALYDGCTRQFDDCVGEIINTLKRTGLDRNTVVIITSDHGDDLYEPGVTLGHGLTFNGGLHANQVPMIVHVPGHSAQTIAETVRLIDVAPTIAELAAIPPSPAWEGQSFAGWLTDPSTRCHRPFYGETGFPFIQFKVPGVTRPALPPMDEMTFIDPSFNYQFVLKPNYQTPLVAAKQRCLRTRDWKLVCTPTADHQRHYALFHLRSDPSAKHDLANSRPEVLAPLRAALDAWIDHQQESPIAQIFPNGEPSHPPSF